ncbi:MAG: 2-succinyl-5-enolpyruvyl-6-hydroxy-3-cyclohexene-1-carboxylic-acid synthase [Flavobacteriaceae bacterium]|nr:2-succinyl-5-enolpyruvyl-6-hydroxy-3-cyclohexene-1-carboxylic-acid synthase [Flavobacteriaceae bacterium]
MMFPKIPAAQTVILYCKKYQIEDVVISPGSRNAPLTIGFASNPNFNCYSIIDERSAGFFALGIAQQKQKPVILLCTSGSALLNYYPAVSEAYYSRIPLIILSCDRPTYKVDIGDGQTIIQSKVFEKNISCSESLIQDVSHNRNEIFMSNRQTLIKKGADSKLVSKTQKKIQSKNQEILKNIISNCLKLSKPVHLNIPLEEPLYNFDENSNIQISDVNFISRPDLNENKKFNYTALQNNSKILVLIGCLNPEFLTKETIGHLANDGRFVVLTETTSNVNDKSFFGNIDKLIAPIEYLDDKKKIFKGLAPDLLLTLGGMVISKKIKKFLRNYGIFEHIHVGEYESNDTFFKNVLHVKINPNTFFENLFSNNKKKSKYFDIWNKIQLHREIGHKKFIKRLVFCDLYVYSCLVNAIPKNTQIQAANSSSIRYLQLFKMKHNNTMYCNRGTSGIDGCTSTSVGSSNACSDPVLLITGDLSFFYDINGLWNNYIKSDFRIIIINNGGGGIFRILPGFKNNQMFSQYIETKQVQGAKQLAKHFGFSYQNKKTKFGLKLALRSFFKKSNKPKILEISTSSETSSSILKSYFKFLSKPDFER